MSELEVRIVNLEPVRVAYTLGFSETPEDDAWKKMRGWAEKNGVLGSPETRNFGFNNPNPSPGSPNYGYEIWLTVGPDVEGEGDVQIKEFPGGRYGVTRFKDLNNIGKVWKQLVTWRENSEYKCGYHQWLEELLTSSEIPPEEYVFDLYLPISD